MGTGTSRHPEAHALDLVSETSSHPEAYGLYFWQGKFETSTSTWASFGHGNLHPSENTWAILRHGNLKTPRGIVRKDSLGGCLWGDVFDKGCKTMAVDTRILNETTRGEHPAWAEPVLAKNEPANIDEYALLAFGRPSATTDLCQHLA